MFAGLRYARPLLQILFSRLLGAHTQQVQRSQTRVMSNAPRRGISRVHHRQGYGNKIFIRVRANPAITSDLGCPSPIDSDISGSGSRHLTFCGVKIAARNSLATASLVGLTTQLSDQKLPAPLKDSDEWGVSGGQ